MSNDVAVQAAEPPPSEPERLRAGRGSVVITAQNVSRRYGVGKASHLAVDGVSLEVRAGEVLALTGPSGCGKSTLLSILGGLDRDFDGSVRLFGRELSEMGDRELSQLRGQRLGFVFQAFHLLPHLDVLTNVCVPGLFAPRGSRERAEQLLARVGLADRAKSFPSQLSGGQRQRVAIARALFVEPDLLLCDEPTGNLDQQTGQAVIDLFAELHAELGITIIIVTHEARASAIATRHIAMLDGRLVDVAEEDA